MPKYNIGDLVTLSYAWSDRPPKIGIVSFYYMFQGVLWYKVRWNNGGSSDLTESELQKLKTDKKCP